MSSSGGEASSGKSEGASKRSGGSVKQVFSYFVFNALMKVLYCVFCLFSAVVGIVIHPGEQFFGGAPDHVVAAGRPRARVRDSGLRPNFQRARVKLSFFKVKIPSVKKDTENRKISFKKNILILK